MRSRSCTASGRPTPCGSASSRKRSRLTGRRWRYSEFRKPLQVGRHAKARFLAELHVTRRDRRDRSAREGAERVRIRIHLEQAVAAHRREEVRGCEKADSAAEKVRAVAQARFADALR